MGIVIPEVLNHYNVYNDKAKKLIGISGEIELGELEALTDTLEGAGVLGEIEDAVTGQFASIKIKIPFSVLYEDMFSIIDTTNPPQLTLRASMQCMDPTTGATGYYPVKIVVRGKAHRRIASSDHYKDHHMIQLLQSAVHLRRRINGMINRACCI